MTESKPATEIASDEYDRMIEQVDATIGELQRQIQKGEVDDPETESVRLKQFRTLGYLVRTKRQVIKDRTLEELAAEVEELKESTQAESSVSIGSTSDQ